MRSNTNDIIEKALLSDPEYNAHCDWASNLLARLHCLSDLEDSPITFDEVRQIARFMSIGFAAQWYLDRGAKWSLPEEQRKKFQAQLDHEE